MWQADWASFSTKEVHQYLRVFWGVEFIGLNNLAPHIFKKPSLTMIILPEKHQPSTLQIKAFSLCLYFWSPTLYTVLFDHAYHRRPRHQSTV